MRTEELQYVMSMLYTAKKLYDIGRSDILDIVDSEISPDDCMSFGYEAVQYICDCVYINYSEMNGSTSFYFSDESIMKYYRLCREYSRLKGVTLKDNPYMKEAEENVRENLDSGCYYCYYRLQTKINHDWSAGIAFYCSSEFYEFDALVYRMADVMDFFIHGAETLEKEVDNLKQEKTKPIQARFVRAKSSKIKPAQAEPVQAESIQAESIQAEPVHERIAA